MQVRAKCWVKYGGAWRRANEVFEIADADWETMKKCADAIEKPVEKAVQAKAEAEKDPSEIVVGEPAKRTRRRKTEE